MNTFLRLSLVPILLFFAACKKDGPLDPEPEPQFPKAGPPALDLGTAFNFTILAKSGISTTGGTTVDGDIGVSPISGVAMTGFSLVMDSSNTFATSAKLAGRAYGADYATPTPAMMSRAISDMEAAFAEAAAKGSPNSTNQGGGSIGGMTFVPGLYKWTTPVVMNSTVTLDGLGEPNAVFIFQISGDLTLGSGVTVNLAGGSMARNIYWQVNRQAILGTTCYFKGNILAKTLIAMKTGARLEGRALAQTGVTLDNNPVMRPD